MITPMLYQCTEIQVQCLLDEKLPARLAMELAELGDSTYQLGPLRVPMQAWPLAKYIVRRGWEALRAAGPTVLVPAMGGVTRSELAQCERRSRRLWIGRVVHNLGGWLRLS